MNPPPPWLSRTSVLCLSFAAMVLLMGLLRRTGTAIGGMLDLQWSGGASRALLARLSPYQRDIHAHATMFYDSLYPLAYGAFFCGLAVRLGGRGAAWIVATMLAGMIADYAENIVQLMALSGRADLLVAKTVLTPLKFGLIALAIVATLRIAALAAWQRLRQNG